MLGPLDSTSPSSLDLVHLILFKDPDPHYTSLLSPYVSKLDYLPILVPAPLPFSPIPSLPSSSSSCSESSCPRTLTSLAFIFTSKHAATYFLSYLTSLTSSSSSSAGSSNGMTFFFFAVGNATAAPLRQAGYDVLGTNTGSAEALAEFIHAWSFHHVGVEYWYIAGKESLDRLPDLLLHQWKLPLHILRVYQMRPTRLPSPFHFTNDQIWVLFSPRGVHLLHTHLLSISSSSSSSSCVWPSKVIAIGPTTAQALKSLGVIPTTCTEPTPEAILTILKQWTATHPSEIQKKEKILSITESEVTKPDRKKKKKNNNEVDQYE